MNAGSLTERVYDALKERLTDGEFRPGDKLDAATLAGTLVSSVTPVRDALHLLSGERLVESHTGTGFSVPHVTDADLRDLYEWSGQILALAVKHSQSPVIGSAAADDSVDASSLFEEMAASSRNVEHAAAIAAVNARLSLARSLEPSVLDGMKEELRSIREAFVTGDTTLHRLIASYHRRRIRAATDIARALYRDA